jgi:hypothetical protein
MNTENENPFFHPKPTNCKRCGFEFTLDDPPTECGECDSPTLCESCAKDHACCQPDECLRCSEKTTLSCINCPHLKEKTSEWLLSCHQKPRIQGYIVELEPNVWLCDEIKGDPGRTLTLKNATRYKTLEEAERAMDKAKTYRIFPNHAIYPFSDSFEALKLAEKAQQEWIDKGRDITKPTTCGLCQSPDLKDLSVQGSHYSCTMICNFCEAHWYSGIWRDRETWFKWINGENSK